MKILFTQHGLVNPGGTELFVAEVTLALHARGHEVAVYAGEAGEPAERLRRNGVAVVADPRDCPWEPDIIHGQHRIHALKALAAFPSCPAVLHLHGLLHFLEKPFIHPRIGRYLVTTPWLAERWTAGLGLPREKFETVLNHVDTARFPITRVPPDRPRKALVFGNSGIGEEQSDLLREACGAAGLELDFAGKVSGRYESVPGQLLPRYDLVFAVGRCALEAAASGCGVIPVYRNMADELLGTQNYERLRAQNMSVRLARHEKLTKAWLIKQIDRWDGADIGRVAKRIREDASLDGVANQLENIYKRVAADFPLSARQPLEEELCAALAVLRDEDWQELHRAKQQAFELARRLHDSENRNTSLEQDVHVMRAEMSKLKHRIGSMESSRSWRLTRPLRAIDEHWRRQNAGSQRNGKA